MHIWVILKGDNDSDYSYWQSAYESIDDRAESIPVKLKKPWFQSFCNINFSKINLGDYRVVQKWNPYRTAV